MAKKLMKVSSNEDSAVVEAVKYKVINCVESIQSVPYFTDEGKTAYLNLRIQGKGGQVPPVIASEAVTDGMRALVKKKMIRLEKV